MAADGVNDALNGGVIGRIQFMVNRAAKIASK